jgi:hypothetical protein
VTCATLSFSRLPTPVNLVFAERLRQVLPARAKVILTRAKTPECYAKLAAALYATPSTD